MYTPVGYLTGQRRTSEEWKWTVDSWQRLAPAVHAAGIEIALEPLNRFETYFLNTVADATKLCDAIGDPAIGILLDTFHANIEEKSIGDAVRQAAPHLKHLHTCENDRGTPGSGHVAWQEFFSAVKEIGYDRWLTIESFGFALGPLSAAAAIWRDLLPRLRRSRSAASSSSARRFRRIVVPPTRRVALIYDCRQAYDLKVMTGVAAYLQEGHHYSVDIEESALKDQRLPDLRSWPGDGIIADFDDHAVARLVMQSRLPDGRLRRRVRVVCERVADPVLLREQPGGREARRGSPARARVQALRVLRVRANRHQRLVART